MLIRIILSVLFLCAIPLKSFAAVCSNPISYTDGAVLTAAQLNSSFNTIYSCANTIDNANITSTANILPIKLDPTVADVGIGRNATTGVLSVNVDDVGIEISGDDLQLKDSGVTTAKINDSAVTTAKINDGAVTQAKRAALGHQLSSSSGSIITSPAVANTFYDLTNLTISITTTGRPVYIGLISDGSGSSASVGASQNASTPLCQIKFVRGSTDVSQQYISIASPNYSSGTTRIFVPASSFNHIDVPTSGTYTYKAQATCSSTAATYFVQNIKMIAYEL